MPLPPYLQHFTDRQDQINAFDALWPGDGRWLLAFSGVSGNGKFTLINWLIETACKPRGILWRKVDFYTSPPLEAVPCALAELAGAEAATCFEQAAASARQQRDGAVDEINRTRAARPFSASIKQVASGGGHIEASPPKDVLYFLKRTDEALGKYEAALALFKQVGDRLGEANVLLSKGKAALQAGDEQVGLTQLERAAQLYEAVGAQSGSANVRITLALHVASKDDFQAAINYLQPAADFGKRIGHPLGDQLQA
jgi:tetratricopeptide (TPR) repeat protein